MEWKVNEHMNANGNKTCPMEGHALTGTKSMSCFAAQLLVMDVTMYTSRAIEREVESIGIY